MPLYDFKCQQCQQQTEIFLKLDQDRDNLTCVCGGAMERIVVLGHGGFQSTAPKWLDDHVRGCLQDDDAVAAGAEKPIEDRADYNRYLKRHDIVSLA